MKVVIAEKPSVARDIARVLSATEKKNGYYEGNDWQVTWAFGHLVGLCEPEVYGWGNPWTKDVLPMLPNEFKLQLLNNDGYSQQYKTIKDLFSNAEYIVCATDAGREGELIFRNIYNYMECKTPVKRLWISSLTDNAIKQGFDNLKDGANYDNIFHSAESRAKADWIIGLNATRSLTLANPNKGVFTIGRVQTPTFSFVCERYYENKNFVPSTYFKLKAKLATGDKASFFAYCPDTFDSKQSAEEKIEQLGDSFRLIKKENKVVKEKAPLPFSLTDLQQTANKELGLSAQDTLTALQSLYEAKMTTYPRTDSSYLAEDMIDPITGNIGKLDKLNFLYTEQKNAVSFLKQNGIQKACFDNSKLTDHHAVIPTFEKIENYDNLKPNEQNIYKLVVKRFIQALMQPCVKEQLIYTFNAEDGTEFRCHGTTIKQHGWRAAYPVEKKREDDEENEDQQLPPLVENEDLNVNEVFALERKTKRPQLLTEAELLKLMESAGKMIEDKELSKAIKDCGLGTPATRASIIESLKSRAMIDLKEKKYLAPTERGLSIYEGVKNLDLSKPDVTGEWENKLNKIAEGSYSPDSFISEISEKCKSLVTELDSVKIMLPSEAVCECPKCGKKVVEYKSAFSCMGNTKENATCDFIVWKNVCGYTLDRKDLLELLSKKVIKDKPFTSKEGKNFRANLTLQPDCTTKIEIPKVDIGVCPICGAPIKDTPKTFCCSKFSKEDGGCTFIVWKEVSGHTLTIPQIQKLLKGETLSKVKMISKAGKNYEADLVLEGNKVVMKF